MRVQFFLVTAWFTLFAAGGALADDARLPLFSLIVDLDHEDKNEMRDMPDSAEAILSFTEMLESALSGDQAEAAAAAKRGGYRITQVTQSGRDYTLMTDAEDDIGPTIVLAATPQRDLIFEAPHGVADRATDIQSVIALTRLGARALVLAGAHRCAARWDTTCSGKTRICGDGRQPYRTSDVAHNTKTRFHLAHLALTKAWPQSTVVQLHGFGRKGTDSWVVISDSSREERSGDTALTGKVRDGVRDWFGKPERAVSCQDPDDERYDYRTLCARTNVQGRHLNGSANACTTTSETASGRFLHVEQSWEIRREAREHWKAIDQSPLATVVIDAIGKAVSCTLGSCP